MAQYQKTSTLVLQGDKSIWITPSCLTELLQLKSLYPLAPLVVGNTFIGPQIEMVGSFYPVIISPSRVSELSIVNYTAKGITIGAACSLAMVKSILSEAVTQLPKDKNKIFCVVIQLLTGEQINSEASIGGSILSRSTSWELNPILAAGNCTFNLASKDRIRQVTLGQLFDVTGIDALSSEEILISINIPFSKKWEFVSYFRQVQQWRNAAPAIVSAMGVTLKENTDFILAMNIYYGGSFCGFANVVCKKLVGRHWNESMLNEACRFFLEEDSPIESAHIGMMHHERTLAISFLFKFYLQVAHELKLFGNINSTHYSQSAAVKDLQQMASNDFHNHLYENVNGHLLLHQSHVLPAIEEEHIHDDEAMTVAGKSLFLELVTSNRHHAKILSIKKEDALKVHGVFDVITAADIRGLCDSDLFAEDKVEYYGQVICAVIADTQSNANQGVSKIRIEYEDLDPILLSIQDAIKNNSYFEPLRKLEHGNVEEAFKIVDHVLEGEEYIGDPDDFHMGPQMLRVIPRGEDNQLELFLPTKDAAVLQARVSSLVNVPSDQLICRMTKEEAPQSFQSCMASLAAICVVAALKSRKSVQSVLERKEDVSICRHHHCFLGKYKVGCMNDGTIVAVDVTYYCNAGYRPDEYVKVFTMCLLSSQNSYKIPNARCRVVACRTNLPAQMITQGYGFPQVGILAELWVDAVARQCNLSPEKELTLYIEDCWQVRHMNLHKATSQTSFKENFDAINLLECWNECMIQSSYNTRKAAAQENNKRCTWKKKGFSIIPVMFPVGFIADYLNQACVLVHISKDGWVLVIPAGNDIGDESNTRIMQVVSQVLQIPLSCIHISETSTTASVTSVMPPPVLSAVHTLAVQDACQMLLHRLQPIMSLNPDVTWIECVQKAVQHRICLSAVGNYRNADAVLDWDLKEGAESPDFVFGAACSEVELDCHTGEHKNLRTDIVISIGSNICQNFYTEQIKKAFVQGLDFFTRNNAKLCLQASHDDAEEFQCAAKAPEILNVALLPLPPNPYMICSPKAIEEVSLFLASSVFFAIKDAVLAARHHTGLPGNILLPIPTRPQHVQLACGNYLATSTVPIAAKEESLEKHVLT